jgi:hypothetical protein
MSNEKYYTYYKSTKEEAKERLEFYRTNFEGKREEVLTKLLADSGAVGFTTTSSWGNDPILISYLAYPHDYDFGIPYGKLKIVRYDWLNNKKVIIARGKMNTVEGRELNKKLEGFIKPVNDLLKKLPTLKQWLVNEYNIAYQSTGEATGSGIALISTVAGTDSKGELILIRIPNKEKGARGSTPPKAPKGFEQITYGQFYDLANKE